MEYHEQIDQNQTILPSVISTIHELSKDGLNYRDLVELIDDIDEIAEECDEDDDVIKIIQK
jgi:hypothetical protein